MAFAERRNAQISFPPPQRTRKGGGCRFTLSLFKLSTGSRGGTKLDHHWLPPGGLPKVRDALTSVCMSFLFCFFFPTDFYCIGGASQEALAEC